MEIIKPRTDQKLTVTCPHCGALIGYYKTDEKAHWLPARCSRYSHQPPVFICNYIICPSCSLEIRTYQPGNK